MSEEDLFLLDERVYGRRAAQASPSAPSIVPVLLRQILNALENLGNLVSGGEQSPGERALGLGHGGGNPSSTGTLIATNRGQSVKCSTKFDRPQAFTVRADINTLGMQAQLTVESRLGGSIIQRTYDVAAGLTVTGFGDSVSATLSDNTTLGTYSRPVAVFSYTGVVSIAPGARNTSAVPPVQTGATQQNIAAGATATFAAPVGAIGVYIYGVSGGQAATLYADHYTAGTIGGGGTAALINRVPVDALQSQPVPLIAGVQQIQVTNEGASTAAVTVVWAMDG